MRVAEIFPEKNMPKYSQALLGTESRKTCTNLATSLNETHDSLYKPFRSPTQSKNEVFSELIKLGQAQFKNKKIKLIFDDTQISKPYAKEIEGLDLGFDGSAGRAELGLQIVNALLTDGHVKLPIDLRPYISKQLSGKHFKTKSQLAAEITMLLIEYFEIDILLADAHYATKYLLKLLYQLGMAFLMKIPCNRIVTIGKKTGQLKQILRLRKNERIRFAKGFFDGFPFYFYVAKIKEDITVYFISLNLIKPTEVIELYRIRWSVELYHRTAKQSLGLKDCQMRSIEKQELHMFYVMLAYALAEIIRFEWGLSCTEEAIRLLGKVKLPPPSNRIFASAENLC